jgi:class 3 adenylate cyclase
MSKGDAIDSEAPRVRGERRVATVVFSDLAGYTAMNEALDPEDVMSVLARVRDMTERVAADYGGIVNQIVGDEALLVFGMPLAHDDDALRAVRAALALHEQVDQLGAELRAQLGVELRMHTGIHTGLVLFTQGNSRVGTYGLTGDTVITAARLRAEAQPGDVLIGPSTQQVIAPFFETEASEPLQLKGKAQPLCAHRVVGRSALHTRFDVSRARGLHEHVGRKREIDRLSARLVRAREGELQAVAVVADPGMGKSRLLHELRLEAAGRGYEVLCGRCEPFGSVPPYQPFLDALRVQFGIHDGQSRSESVARVQNALSAIAPELAAQVPALLEFLSLAGGSSSRADASPAALHEQNVRTLLALFTELSRREGLVLILEDWHWADEASERLLAQLLDGLARARVLVAISYRPERQPAWERRLDELIRLASLGPRETSALARAVLKVDAVSEALGSLLFERTAGNPLFIEEFCRALGEAGCVVVENAAARLSSPDASAALPDGVLGAIQSRIDRLAPAQRRLLSLAAVVGTRFSSALLALVGGDGADVASVLERLTEMQLVRRQPIEGSYAFGHALIHQVAYEGLLKSERRALHARVAEGLEATFADGRLPEHYESLARHFGLGGAMHKAAQYSELAGDKAARAYALESGSLQFQHALEYLEAMPADDVLLRRRVDMALKWGRASIWRPSPSQVGKLRDSAEQARAIGYERGAAWALYWLGWHDYTLGHQRQAIADFEACLAAATRLSDVRLMAQARANQAYSHAAGRDYARAEAALEESDGLRRQISANRLWGDMYSLGYRGLIAGDRGDFAAAYRALSEALETTTVNNDVATQGSVLTQLGIVQAQQGAFEALRRTAQRLRPIAERVEAYYLMAMSKTFEGYAELHLGQVRLALPPLFEAVDALEEMSLMLTMSFNYACLAEALASADQPERAERYARLAIARGAHGDKLGDTMAHRALGVVTMHRRAPDPAAALAHVARALELASEYRLPRERALSGYTRARILHAMGDHTRAAHEARSLRPELERMQMTHYASRCAELETLAPG